MIERTAMRATTLLLCNERESPLKLFRNSLRIPKVVAEQEKYDKIMRVVICPAEVGIPLLVRQPVYSVRQVDFGGPPVGTSDVVAGRLQMWLDRLQAGDESARDELITHSCERLRSLARKIMRKYRRLQRWEETDDIFQDAVLRLHRSLQDLKPESVRQFFGLAATQIRRTLIDFARRHFGPEGIGAEFVGFEAAEVAADGPVDLQQWAEFYEVLDNLPAEERAVVDLLWFEGLTQAEAAIALGVSVSTIRRTWYSARYFLYKAAPPWAMTTPRPATSSSGSWSCGTTCATRDANRRPRSCVRIVPSCSMS